MPRTPIIAICGTATPSDALALAAEAIGRGLVDHGCRIATGGLGGVMTAASRGARSSKAWRDGCVIGVLPGPEAAAANPFVDIAVPTGMGTARNVVLVLMADVVVVIGGGAGTLSELALAWQHGKAVVALDIGEGWSARLAGQAIDDRREGVVLRAGSAAEVVALVRGVLAGE